MVQGLKPDEARRQQVRELREHGLTLAQIGLRLGVTSQCVYGLLRPPKRRIIAPRCPVCQGPLPEAGVSGPRDATALCLPCLRQRPHTPFALRLKAVRLAAGLTRAELSRRSGVSAPSLRTYECGGTFPAASALVRLIRTLGSDLLAEHDGAAEHKPTPEGQG
jgi:transcriptional regulator with XRE-family HTH domain